MATLLMSSGLRVPIPYYLLYYTRLLPLQQLRQQAGRFFCFDLHRIILRIAIRIVNKEKDRERAPCPFCSILLEVSPKVKQLLWDQSVLGLLS